VVTAVRFPAWDGRCGFAIEEFARRKGDFALAGALCGVEIDADGVVRRAAIAMMGMGQTPLRADAAEASIVGSVPDPSLVADAGRLAAGATAPSDDLHGSRSYRQRLAAHLVASSLSSALKEANGG
jgi:carbon-monoxide dehydrogenase medium subunit